MHTIRKRLFCLGLVLLPLMAFAAAPGSGYRLSDQIRSPAQSQPQGPMQIDPLLGQKMQQMFQQQPGVSPESLNPAFNALKQSISLMQQQQQAVNTSLSQCIAKTYSIVEQNQANCGHVPAEKCSSQLVMNCIEPAVNGLKQAEQLVHDKIKMLLNQLADYMPKNEKKLEVMQENRAGKTRLLAPGMKLPLKLRQ